MSVERFRPGQRVQALRHDPDGHNRVPRYVRGAVGVVVEPIGEHPLPDHAVQGVRTVEPVYTVRFAAGELFGQGSHAVTVDIWQSHLEAR